MPRVRHHRGMTGTDLVDAAVADLYARDPDTFTERRRELVARARAARNNEAARAIAGLRKPTRSAWVVNALSRSDPSVVERLAELAARLRAGEAELDGAAIRELSAARRQLIESLTRQALEHAGLNAPPAGLRDEVAATLTAALADPEVAAEVTAGTLLRAAQWTGFSPQIGTAVPPRQAAGRQAVHDERRARDLVLEQALSAVARAQAKSEKAAAAARHHEGIVTDLERQLSGAISRSRDAQRDAAQAARELEHARNALAAIERRHPPSA